MTETAVAQELAYRFDGLMNAFNQAYKRRQEQLAIHDAVIASIPEKPKRGSYYWWARIARENTGSSLCDSGGAYGYQYMRGVPPEDGSHLDYELWNGKIQGVRINTIKFLETMFDANDEIAEALEKVMYWVGIWLYPRENWGVVIHNLPDALEMLYDCIAKTGLTEWTFTISFPESTMTGLTPPTMRDTVSTEEALEMWPEYKKEIRDGSGFSFTVDSGGSPFGDKHVSVAPHIYDPVYIFCKNRRIKNAKVDLRHLVETKLYGMSTYDLQSWQQKLSGEEYVEQALADFPVDAIKLLFTNDVKSADGRDVYENPGSFYTYNHENDFSQDWMLDKCFSSDWGLYGIVRTHNGCDARGGYSSPAVGVINDVGYLFGWQADGNCMNCDSQFYSMYEYDRETEKANIIAPDVNKLIADLEKLAEIEAGQQMFTEWKWPYDFSPDDARAILAYMKEDGEDKEEEWGDIPPILCQDEHGTYAPLENGYVPEQSARLYCPDCGQYTVRFYSVVYGF